jgi:hypothetical protein
VALSGAVESGVAEAEWRFVVRWYRIVWQCDGTEKFGAVSVPVKNCNERSRNGGVVFCCLMRGRGNVQSCVVMHRQGWVARCVGIGEAWSRGITYRLCEVAQRVALVKFCDVR